MAGGKCLGGAGVSPCGLANPVPEATHDVPLVVVVAARKQKNQPLASVMGAGLKMVDVDAAAANGAVHLTGWMCKAHSQWTTCGGACGKAIPFEDRNAFSTAGGTSFTLTYKKMKPDDITAVGCSTTDWRGRERRWCRACLEQVRRPAAPQLAAAAAAPPPAVCACGSRCMTLLAHEKKLKKVNNKTVRERLVLTGPGYNLTAIDEAERVHANAVWLLRTIAGAGLSTASSSASSRTRARSTSTSSLATTYAPTTTATTTR